METSNKKRVAVLYICTGKYNRFFKSFYESAGKYLLCGHEKHFFVFTDQDDLSDAPDVTLIHRECQGFPTDSLMRFDMFLSIRKQLEAYDYLFFFNANLLFVSPVGEEILPTHLTAVVHPGFYDKPAWRYPYERNPLSTAYVEPRGKNYRYFMGSLNGGTTVDYLRLAETCSLNIHTDLAHGIVAIYHDESHLNSYLRQNGCTPLSPAYACIEGKKMPFEPKLILRDKTLVDPYFNKGRDRSPWGMFKKGLTVVWRAVKWYL